MNTDSVSTIIANDEWLQFYQESLMEEEEQPLVPIDELFDATNVTNSTPAAVQKPSEPSVSPSNSTTAHAHAHQLVPKSNVSKPIRRRSRVSKKTPITLLNASTTNFRALVQQFTGCPSKAASFADHKGPITLDFERGTGHPPLLNPATVMAKSFRSDCGSVSQFLVQKQQLQQQLISQPADDGSFSLGNAGRNPLYSSGLSNCQTSMNIIDHGLAFDHDIPLQELTINSFYQQG